MTDTERLLTEDEVTESQRLDYEQLVDEVGRWSEDNFDDQPVTYPVEGAVEEIGELTHSHLKRAQGIREDDDDVGPRAEADAVADTVIYLCDYLGREDSASTERVVKTVREHRNDSVSDTRQKALSAASWFVSDLFYGTVRDANLRVEKNVGAAIAELQSFAFHSNMDFQQVVIQTWESVVSERDWDAEVTGSADD